ncbi:tRNA (adenosine(37)-N6)-threonylcarbamoyltransferase complex dimerization subunit type 1 TsaB [Inmirania thermothiophila]|uniref:tRNA threonylcarbamoyladenosine biosynthesis protein TsaB n=1 Tax=Inmirania thermothiophila TaxID=1750597 RepID=A0A3N1Y261_9GAMM|nr:tRNA (adenosine(37)-N6)-threonylcarbamoyltransferase complex dimerization subunit type 1 TsaB [Inmirania thermothiophila]ROR32608.1 tRNA threonylcarbamoyladenosine biosynthesis protein TsaB [Inmirania thermothiophila]
MRLLALEGATEVLSVALWEDGEVAVRRVAGPREHARRLLVLCDALLAEAGWRPADLDGLAVGRGPGAFTGVRVAVAAAQGIAFGLDRPVAAVSTLAALARGAARRHRTGRVLAALDARMGEVYWGAFEVGGDGGVTPAGPERVGPPRAVPPPPGAGWLGAGPGWAVWGEVLAAVCGGAVHAQDPQALPDACDVAALGARILAAGGGVAPEALVPVYLRDRVASPP